MSGFTRLERWRRRLLIGAGVLLVLSTMAACTVSVLGGVAGALVSVLGAVALIAGITTTQSGCDTTSPCLSYYYEPDAPDGAADALVQDVGPCLSIAADAVGPCLGAPLEDVVGPCLTARPDDVGPCLGAPLDDVGPCLQPRWDVGPCLSDAYEDVGPCLSRAEDIGPCLSPRQDDVWDGDAPVGPCLSQPAPDTIDGDTDTTMAPGPGIALSPRDVARAEVRSRLTASGALPDDLAARLRARRPQDRSRT